MATTVKQKASAKTAEAPPIEPTEPVGKHKVPVVTLKDPFDGITELSFDRMTFAEFRAINSKFKSTAVSGQFVMDKAKPSISQEQVTNNLSGRDMAACDQVMIWLTAGRLEDNRDGSIWDDDRVVRQGKYDKATRTLTLGFPIKMEQMEAGEKTTIYVDTIVFKESVPFGRSGTIDDADDGLEKVQRFIRIYGSMPQLALSIISDATSDLLDISDVLLTMDEVMDHVLGNAGTERLFQLV